MAGNKLPEAAEKHLPKKPSESEKTVGQLTAMIGRAQEERFRLLREIRNLQNGSQDDSPGDTEALDEIANASDRMRTLDGWVARRLDDFRRADEVIENRLHQMKRSEESFNRLTSILQTQLEAAKPTGHHLADLKRRVQAELDRTLEKARLQIEHIAKPLDQHLEDFNSTEREINDRLTKLKQQSEKAFSELRAEFSKTIEQGKATAAAVAKPFSQDIAEQAEVCQGRVEIAVEAAEKVMAQRVASLEREATVAADQAHNQFRQRLANAQKESIHRFSQLDNQVQGKLTERISTHEEAVQVVMETAESSLRQQMNGLQKEIASISNLAAQDFEHRAGQFQERIQKHLDTANFALDTQTTKFGKEVEEHTAIAKEAVGAALAKIEEGAASTHKQAERQQAAILGQLNTKATEIVDRTRVAMSEQVSGLEQDLSKRLGPLVQRGAQRVHNFQDQAQTVFDTVQNVLPDRVDELRSNTERVIDMVDQEMARRIKDFHPEATAAVQSAQKLVNERLAQLQANAQATVELNEKQLTEKLEALGRRAQFAMSESEHAINDRLVRLRGEADSMTVCLERRLAQRVEQLTAKSRSAMGEAIEKIDQATKDAEHTLRRADEAVLDEGTTVRLVELSDRVAVLVEKVNGLAGVPSKMPMKIGTAPRIRPGGAPEGVNPTRAAAGPSQAKSIPNPKSEKANDRASNLIADPDLKTTDDSHPTLALLLDANPTTDGPVENRNHVGPKIQVKVSGANQLLGQMKSVASRVVFGRKEKLNHDPRGRALLRKPLSRTRRSA